MCRANVVVVGGFVNPGGVPVIVTVESPTVAVLVVLIVRVAVKGGLAVHMGIPAQPPVNEAVAPEGRPVTVRVTGWVVPESSAAVMVVTPDWPWVTVTPAVPAELVR
jgi:hypothetical protein